MRLNNNLLKLHVTIFIWGFTAILGALISLNALHLVWYRMLIAAVSMLVYIVVIGGKVALAPKQITKLLLVGGIVAAHWLTFFHAIKIANVSVALVSLSAAALFTSFMEPLWNRKKVYFPDIIAALFIILGIYLIFKFESNYTWGIITGLASALFAAIFTTINAKEIQNKSAEVISFYEMAGGFIVISLYLIFTQQINSSLLTISIADLGYLLVLGTVCTAMAYVMGVAVMKELSAYTVVLTTNLEPVYGIILAYFIFGEKEHMTAGFYFGAALILLTIFIYPILKKRLNSSRLV